MWAGNFHIILLLLQQPVAKYPSHSDSYEEYSPDSLLASDNQTHPYPIPSMISEPPHQPFLQSHSLVRWPRLRSSSYSETSKTEKRCSAFLIGSNIRGVQAPGSCAAIPRNPLNKSSKNPLDGVLKDLRWMKSFMNGRNIPVYEVVLGNRHVKQDKNDILEVFRKFFSQKNIRRYVIYYSGHGSNGTFDSSKGDWCFETSSESESKIIYIGLKDILDLWDEMRKECGSDSYELNDRSLLFIIADSCYSGNWVEEIKTKRTHKTTLSGENYRDVHMIASCQSDETCYYNVTYGGDFTRRYITADSSKHNLKPTAVHIAKLAGQSVIQGVTFPLYMPLKGLSNFLNTKLHKHTPVATNEREEYRILLMKYDGEVLPIGRGLGIASGWSWMLSGQIFHN